MNASSIPPSDSERDVMALMLSSTVQAVADVLRGGDGDGDCDGDSPDRVMRAIAATRTLGALVEDTLRALVDRARREGRTWAEIGDVLHVSRQAAFQRFGGASRSDPAGAGDGEAVTLPDAAERALPVLEDLLAERYDAVRARFDERMLEACSVERLQQAVAQVRTLAGAVLDRGTPSVTVRVGYTVVDVPMNGERSEFTGRVALDADGRVAGLFLLPPGAV